MDVRAININNAATSIDSKKAKASDSSFEKNLENAVNKSDDQQLKKVCKEFEGILLNMMYKQMKASIPKSDLMPSDMGKDIFESMLDEELMGEVSTGRGVGLADVLYKQLSKRAASENNQEESTEELKSENSK